MSDENPVASAVAATPPTAPSASDAPAVTKAEPSKEEATTANEPKETAVAEAGKSTSEEKAADKLDTGATEEATDKPADSAENEMNNTSAAGPEPGVGGKSPTTPSSKAKGRRKSTGGGASGGKKLNKKASKAKITHLDAKPGDHYFVKLKGFPQWPAIICDEDMLPQALIKSRPVTAIREDGTYREDYADGGKRAGDRTYPVMYLYTNEFGWIPNTDLYDLDPETVLDVKMDKMRKDLQEAHKLAAENNSLDHYKEVLQKYQEDLIEKQKAKEAKAHSTPAKKSKKAKVENDEDVEMADAGEEGPKDKKAKKRKADENAEAPGRSDSVKKPRIKLTVNSTPKASNGTSSKSKTPTSSAKPVKIKNKKASADAEDNAGGKAPMFKRLEEDDTLTPQEKLVRKEKEILFIRHKLQKGLLTRDQEPKESEMTLMSDFLAKLEEVPNLEVSIIRATKINKVLKAILKLNEIPREDELRFKPRSQTLLDAWNKSLEAPDSHKSSEAANGVKADGSAAKDSATVPDASINEGSKTNGTGKENDAEEKGASEEKTVTKETPAPASEIKGTEATEEKDTAAATEVAA